MSNDRERRAAAGLPDFDGPEVGTRVEFRLSAPPVAGGAGSTAMMTPTAGTGAPVTPPPDPSMGMGELAYEDPGTSDWTLVPEGEVAEKCKMDIEKLKSTGLSHNFAVFRYGKLCFGKADVRVHRASVTHAPGSIRLGRVRLNRPYPGPGGSCEAALRLEV